MLTAKELAAQDNGRPRRGSAHDPEERFNEMVELGLIDREGRLSSQLGGDAETPPITSPHILAR